ncbi:MAG: ATP-binding protein [Candidatus Altiarchaeota archaeon]|nr:ATP-binding protein [Candidatus Altiarchaeota archaeon]
MEHRKIIIQWKEYTPPKTQPREVNIDPTTDFITTITGPRRAGKTYLCYQLMNHLIDKGTPRENILYVNFEDEKLIGAKAADLEKLMNTFQELTDTNPEHNTYLFLDEIQNVKDWDAWIRRIHDTQKNVKLILTGSSSKMLSREVTTKLRGRILNHEVYPLSFKEYLTWKNTPYNLKTLTESRDRIEVKKQYNEYLTNGGYPTIALNQAPREQILQSYYESMIFKDVVERHNIKDVKKLRILAKLLFESTSKEMSYNRLANKLKSLGFTASKNTIIEHISHFEDAYLFFQNMKHEYSITKRMGAIKKIYCIDNGLLNTVSFKFAEDTGKLMENQVYIELKRRNKQVYYHKDKHECDFLTQEKNKITSAIQVTHTLNDENEDREINGLLEAMRTHNLQDGTILTFEQEETRKKDDKTIRITPVWKWLLET